jgi:hypothetical protein
MRNKFILSALLLVCATGLLWSQFWKDFSDKDRKSIGESYWLAGKQYQSVGKAEKGRDFMDLGQRIYPQLDPAQIKEEKLPSAAELLARGKAAPIGAGASEVPTLAIDSFFLRYIGALLDADPTVADFLAGSVYVSAIPGELSREDALARFQALFQNVTLRGLSPSQVYDLDSIVIAKAPQEIQDAWGPTYTLRVSSPVDYSQYLPFWDAKQQFFVQRHENDYFIIGIGQTPPPLSWSPTQAAAGTLPIETAPLVPEDVARRKAVADAFTEWMSALLAKDADGALSAMSEDIHFLRLDQTVTKEELKVSLLGYYENEEFAPIEASDAVDLDSVFVERAESPIDGVAGTIYRLNARSKTDLSPLLPFWTEYQRYYLSDESGGWRIFALF